MTSLRTTAGQVAINNLLPDDMVDWHRVLDKKGQSKLLAELATKYPEKYREVSHALANIGRRAAYFSGGNSFGLRHMAVPARVKELRKKLQVELDAIASDPALTEQQREELVVRAVGKLQERLPKLVMEESTAEDNPLARQIISGSRGNPGNLASLRAGDLLYTDHSGRVVPVPILRSYSEGLTPAQYWGSTYGARQGVLATKLATARAGYLAKQFSRAAHRLLVTALDEDGDDTPRGLPVDVADEDNEGALLAGPVGGYARNTVLTPKILSDLKRHGVKRILVRSPTVRGAADGGLLARDVGVREFGRLPDIGTQVGISSSQSLSEPLSQAQLSSKHSGGVAGSSSSRAVSGFSLIDQLAQVPENFRDGASHAELDGLVMGINDAAAGGKNVIIDGQVHYVPAGLQVTVRKGQHVEAGDVLSDGIPNPAKIVEHKGVGEGRRYFTQAFRQAFRDAGLTANRRNVEVLSRALIDHVRMNQEFGEWLPGDVASYQMLERNWEPREDAEEQEPRAAVGRYLERPVLHYSIGTKIRPSMLKDFEEFQVNRVMTHREPPPFEPEMIRAAANLQHDPDWMTKMLGSGLKANLLKDVHRGAKSDETGTSFVPGLAKGVNFGSVGPVKTPGSRPVGAPKLPTSDLLR